MVKKPVAGDVGPNTIYKATYRPVYEFICRNVAVMRRKSDAYLNATQILKVAGFDKPQRTRVLEREVQKGEHEKIQGGYGKFQGTWIPIERGLALAKQYNVEDLLRPIIDFVPTSVSPPPAPKHAVAAPVRRKDKDGKPLTLKTPLKTGPQSAAALQAQQFVAAANRAAGGATGSTPDSRRLSLDATSEYGTPADEMSESATPSPIRDALARLPPSDDFSGPGSDMMDVDGMGFNGLGRKRTAAMMEDDEYEPMPQQVRTPPAGSYAQLDGAPAGGMSQDEYNDIVLNYFVSESTQIPTVLTNPPYDWDPDAPIDDDGHTPLHWAAAMGRTRVIKLLLSAGARIFDKNNLEQTALMRSVMFTNNYDLRKFPEVFELLHRSTLNIDQQNRTVFHHIANLALMKGKTHAARYYMEVILSRLADYPQELADVINFQDEDGETALTIAARARSKRIVKSLLDHGADPKIRNRDFKSAEDYILEDERFRSSPDVAAARLPKTALGASVFGSYHPQLYTSEAARLAGGQYLADISAHLQALARSFDAELGAKERDIAQARAMQTAIEAEAAQAGQALAALDARGGALDAKEKEVDALAGSLRAAIGLGLSAGWDKWVRGQEERERRGQDAGDDPGDGDEARVRWEIGELRTRRAELVEKLVSVQAEAGTSEKLAQYRRLIAASVGGVAPSELDAVVERLLETLEMDQCPAQWAT
ncbi:Transcription factor mbp1 [Cryptotrichosporon argae]